MAKKGKEFDLGGVRVQVDPFVLAQRILARQKVFLAIIAVIGGIATVAQYKFTPKVFLSNSSIAIRTERGSENYFRLLVNTAMRDLDADGELMLIINELDLFPSVRANLPYELALRRLRRELQLDRQTGVVNVSFESKDPRQAQQVVAFVTERVLGTFARLLDKPREGQIDALNRRIAELEPELDEARRKLFEFQERHPSIAITELQFVPRDSPLASVNTQIELAEKNLKRCYAGASALPDPLEERAPTPRACLRLNELRSKRARLLQQLTPQHPEVQRLTREVARQKIACENARSQVPRARRSIPTNPKEAQKRCIEDVRRDMKRLAAKKADIEKLSIKKPRLQKEWRELSAIANQLESERRAVVDLRGKKIEQRLLDANDFQENFSLVDPPRVPTIPHKPKRDQFLMIGMAITAVLGLGIAAIREAFRQNFLDPQEFEDQSGLQLLAVLPEIRD